MRAINAWRKRHFLGTDAALALLLASLVIAAAYVTEIGANVHQYVEQNLLLLYRATAAISGALMGFSITVTVLAINFWQSDWFDLVKQNDKSTHEIWATLKQNTWCLALLTLTSLCIIAIGGGDVPAKWTIIPYLIAVLIALARLIRAVTIIHKMMDIAVEASRNN